MTISESKKSIFERTAKLFFFCFMNESKALKMAKIVVDEMFKDATPTETDKPTQPINEEELLKVVHQTYSSNEQKKSQTGISPMLGHFEIPKSLDLGAWREFKRSSHIQEFYTTCLFYVGGFDVKTISSIQKTTEGTIKYRLSHGSKKLGSILLKEYLN